MVLKLLKLVILNLLIHAVEPVFNAILSSASQKLDDFRPTVANVLSEFEDLKIFLWGEGLPVDLWVEEVVPTLSTLFPISDHSKIVIEYLGNLLPLLCPL